MRKSMFLLNTVLVLSLALAACSKLCPPVKETVVVTKEVTREVTVVVIATPEPSPTTPTPSPTPATPTPSPTPDGTAQLWVASLPGGASVYLCPGSPEGCESLEDLPQAKYLLGSTPLATEVSPGQYLLAVVVTVDQIKSAGFEMLPSSHPLFNDAFEWDGNMSWTVTYQHGEVASAAKTYLLRKEAGKSKALVSILIPLPEDKVEQSPPYLYPSLDMVDSLPKTYTVNETDVTSGISDNLGDQNLTGIVPSDMVKDMVQVLYRVGKVKLQADGVEMIVQMSGPRTQSFSIQVRY